MALEDCLGGFRVCGGVVVLGGVEGRMLLLLPTGVWRVNPSWWVQDVVLACMICLCV